MSDHEETKSSFFIGFLAGGVVGAIIALLYAPKTGKELRTDIRHKTEELGENAEEYIAAARNKAVDIINEGKKKSEGLISEAKKRAESLLGDAEKILTETRAKGDSSKSERSRS